MLDTNNEFWYLPGFSDSELRLLTCNKVLIKVVSVPQMVFALQRETSRVAQFEFVVSTENHSLYLKKFLFVYIISVSKNR